MQHPCLKAYFLKKKVLSNLNKKFSSQIDSKNAATNKKKNSFKIQTNALLKSNLENANSNLI